MRGKWESPSINGVVCSAIRVKDPPPLNLPLSRDRLILPCSVSAEGSLPQKDFSVFVDSRCSELTLMDACFVAANAIPTSQLPSPDSSIFVNFGCSELALIEARFVAANAITTSQLPSPDSSIFVDSVCSELALRDARFVAANAILTSQLPLLMTHLRQLRGLQK
jgi:hypothetical protein